MQRRAAIFVAIAFAAGCNALFGIESAVVDPPPDAATAGPDGGASGSESDGQTPDATSSVADAGPCVETQANPRHCGVCNHDCLGGACEAGTCLPFVLATDAGDDPRGLAIGGDAVFWTDDRTGELRRVPKSGGRPTRIHAAAPGGALGIDIAAHGGYVYFAADANQPNSRILRCPESGCSSNGPELAMSAVSHPVSTAIDPATGALVAAEGEDPGSIARCLKPPCATGFDAIATGEKRPTRVAIAGDVIAWTTLGALLAGRQEVRVRTGSSTPRTLASRSGTFALAATSTEVFYTVEGSTIEAIKVDASATRVIARPQATDYLAADTDALYFADTSLGVVYRVALDVGSVPMPLARQQDRPRAVGFDRTSVYWLNTGNGTVVRVAR